MKTINPSGPLHASIRPPGSKSITNRALICAALAEGTSTLCGALDSEDTRVMIDALRTLGLNVAVNVAAQGVTVDGCRGRLPVVHADLFAANSGTTIRFLTAVLATAGGDYRLDGVQRMRQRPLGDLLDALNQLGADVVSKQGNGCPPVCVRPVPMQGGRANIRGDVSSQFLSGLLMAAPCALRDVELHLDGPLVSQPYVRMTLSVMADFGVSVREIDHRVFRIPAPQRYRAAWYDVEPDASAASYFWAAAAVTGGEVTVEGLTRDSLQGDVAFCDCLKKMGCQLRYGPSGITVQSGPLHGVEVDMNPISDTVQTLAAVALFAAGPTTIRGVAHIRHKETDRIGDLARELRKLGAGVDEFPDGLRIMPPQQIRPAEIDTYQDHRMAMSLALVGLRREGIIIKDPECTEKTYPQFFDDLESLTRS